MLTQEEADSIIETINERATEVRQLIITIGSILALLMPAVEMLGVIDLTPYGEGDDEWIGDDDWEWGDDFTCGDGTRIEASAVNDGYKNCRDGSDEPDDPAPLPENNTTVIVRTEGCTDPDAVNYDSDAEEDDGSCEYEEPVEENCSASMWDAYYIYDNETENITLHWDADLTCDDASHNLTVIWTFYYNNTTETGDWAEIQELLTYETYFQDWDYVNLTIPNVPAGRYDIFSTFELGGEYTRGTDWYNVLLE